jgi:hypothetical protein
LQVRSSTAMGFRLSRHDAIQHQDHRDDKLPTANSTSRRRLSDLPRETTGFRSNPQQPERRLPAARPNSVHPPQSPSPDEVAAAFRLARNAIGAFSRIDKLSGRRGIMVRLRGGHRDEAADSPPGTSEHDERSRLTPDTLPHATQPRRCLAPRPTAMAFRDRRDHSQRPVSLGVRGDDSRRGLTHECFHERQSGEPQRHCLGTTPWNHAFDECPTPAARSHLCAPELRSGTSRSRARGAGRRWLASPRWRKSLSLAASVCHQNSALGRQALGLPNDWC